MTAAKPAWYSVEHKGIISDIVNLLHPPYTLWHLSYILIGISFAPRIYPDRSIAVLLAFFLGLGIGAHALDETMGNPLRTRSTRRQLWAIGSLSLFAAAVIGIYYVLTLSVLLVPFIVAELFFAIVYNLEMFERRFHNTVVFAISWGAIPLLTGYFVNALSISPIAFAMSVVAGLLTVVQRTLSTQARYLRRKMGPVEAIQLENGDLIPTTSADIARPAENSLKLLTAAVFILGISLVIGRLLGLF